MADAQANYEELIARCVEREHEALRELYDRCAPQLFGVLIRILSREDLAQEALQDVFVRVWRNAASYRASKGSVLTWMTSIARYRALDIRRNRSHEVHVPDATAYLPADVDAADTDLLAGVQLDADVARLNECFKELSVDLGPLDAAVGEIVWRFTNLFPGCLQKSIDGIITAIDEMG